jgi:alpha-mannosidase
MTTFFPRHSAWVELPACGYKVFTIESDAPPPAPEFSQMHQIASDSFGLKSLRAEDGTELLQGGMGLVVIEDLSDTWAHGVDSFSKEIGKPEFVSSEVVESGPVTRVTRQTLKWKNSVIRVDIAAFSSIDSIQFRFVIDWNEHQEILKLELPTCLANSRVIAKVPGAVIERPSIGNEEPCQDWVAVEGSVGANRYTVGLINDRSYSYSSSDGQLRMILVRSAPYARHNPCPVELDGINAWQDQGRQERSFWLARGSGDFTELFLDRLSWNLQAPAEYVLDSRHGGTEPWEKSFLEVSPSNIEVLAIKQSEDSSALIVRMQERAGRSTQAGLSSRPFGLSAQVALAPWEVKTVRIERNGPTHAIMQVISPLELRA